MATRLTIDPVTRIEGHLRIDVGVAGGRVNEAWASCTMWRGIENILLGRDPREAWLFAQRFCGVCTTVHAIASVRAVEDALKMQIPANAQYIRNLIVIAHAMHDHIVHFYHLSALDWVDVVAALKADPAKAAQLAESISNWPGNSKAKLAAVQAKVKGFVEALVNEKLGEYLEEHPTDAKRIAMKGLDAARVRDNVVVTNREAGMLLRATPGAMIENNLVYGNGGPGIAVGVDDPRPTTGVVLANNTIFWNGSWGILIGSGDVASTGTVIRDNILQQNVAGGVAAGGRTGSAGDTPS